MRVFFGKIRKGNEVRNINNKKINNIKQILQIMVFFADTIVGLVVTFFQSETGRLILSGNGLTIVVEPVARCLRASISRGQ
jgi:hypothetical protein